MVRRIVVVLAAAALCSVGGSTAAFGGGGSSEPVVERVILVQTEPAQAPGSTLYLYRVEVPPGAQIAPHTHPGTQEAHIERGVLTYTLISGSADVITPAADGTEPEVKTVTGPKTVKLRTGMGVVENPDLVHEAENKGKKPVVILLSALLTTGAPLSEPAE
jgi:quercetin dioxygenase-like cupin family protein